MNKPMKFREVRQCVGGWKACVNADSQEMSGPWKSKEAAMAAAIGDFITARQFEQEVVTGTRFQRGGLKA